MFHAARPPLSESSAASWRASVYGWFHVVEKVSIKPIRSVTAATADSVVSGS